MKSFKQYVDTVENAQVNERVDEASKITKRKKPDRYHIVGKDGKPANLASYADRASAIKDRDEKHPGAVVQQVGPRGKVKGVTEAINPEVASTYKRIAVQHLKDIMAKDASNSSKIYAKKMHQRALEASKMSNHTDALNHYRGMKEEAEQGIAEAINPDNPRDYNIPTYLRKRKGQAPLTTKDIKDRDTESPTTPEGLAKKAKKLGLDEISTAYINKQAPDYASRASKQSELLKKKVYSIFKDTAASPEEKQKLRNRGKGLASYRKKASAEYEKKHPTPARKKPDEDKLQSSFRTGRYDDTYGT